MTGQLKAASGTAAAPGMAFGSDTDTGAFLKSANTIGLSAGGTEVATIDSEGIKDRNSVVISGIPTGAVMLYGATIPPTGWVRLNGGTIGSSSSGGLERANADCEDLFSLLWTHYANGVCAVSGGRGASAAADWAANKTITMPDMRGRAPFGLDGMGAASTSRLGSVITGTNTNGSSGGTETVTLTSGQLPANIPNSASTSTVTTTTANESIGLSGAFTARLDGGGTVAQSLALAAGNLSTVTPTLTSASSSSTSVTINAAGGAAHSNMPPAMLWTFLMKL